jgi:hypothetical protein
LDALTAAFERTKTIHLPSGENAASWSLEPLVSALRPPPVAPTV